MRLRRKNEVETWKITRNVGLVVGKQAMSVQRSNRTLWYNMMDIESVEGLVWTVHPYQFTQTTGQLFIM